MAARAISSGTISFGLVSIPVKLYTATSSQKVHFNQLHKKCGGRVKQQYVCPTCDGEIVERNDFVKGYEYARGQFVQFEGDELKALEGERTGTMDIIEFVPMSSVDFVQIEQSYYLGPDKGGDKAYQLLAESMRSKEVVAVGRWAARGKDQLVLIRPYQDGLIFHQLYYANEVRSFEDLDRGAEFSFAEVELDLARKLIDQLTVDSFEPERFSDTYTERVREVIDQKVAGEEITVAPEQPRAQIIDLFEALKQSLGQAPSASNEAGEDDDAAEEPAAKGKKTAGRSKKVSPRPVQKAVPRQEGKKKASG